ncbi:uncharacterized protein LOC123630784 [Lemur catta]|uniref:uncharacterized protein LOC123630784 n=1 Tax=Lemur catta TaxID=9447 RepID=UPI001E267535|nr:uncharacterized protein LOC123630784 [Lemur catta]
MRDHVAAPCRSEALALRLAGTNVAPTAGEEVAKPKGLSRPWGVWPGPAAGGAQGALPWPAAMLPTHPAPGPFLLQKLPAVPRRCLSWDKETVLLPSGVLAWVGQAPPGCECLGASMGCQVLAEGTWKQGTPRRLPSRGQPPLVTTQALAAPRGSSLPVPPSRQEVKDSTSGPLQRGAGPPTDLLPPCHFVPELRKDQALVLEQYLRGGCDKKLTNRDQYYFGSLKIKINAKFMMKKISNMETGQGPPLRGTAPGASARLAHPPARSRGGPPAPLPQQALLRQRSPWQRRRCGGGWAFGDPCQEGVPGFLGEHRLEGRGANSCPGTAQRTGFLGGWSPVPLPAPCVLAPCSCGW